ncbi:unnamed protein product [Vitrella brassicaformis CCMP3155]|uniref:Uncharacterized protein n=1 Tax=Vitrella brassicaformis (strain CCMP3155) TaxID=1169540 RepID=A0A0G4GY10_VITBC|nr:unnamed protein product [Vitrella brassicaformis CCMP3155]|eukprot:CEM35903.1 unnamed protein product [Vitrella brassicaformis CCMP3155]
MASTSRGTALPSPSILTQPDGTQLQLEPQLGVGVTATVRPGIVNGRLTAFKTSILSQKDRFTQDNLCNLMEKEAGVMEEVAVQRAMAIGSEHIVNVNLLVEARHKNQKSMFFEMDHFDQDAAGFLEQHWGKGGPTVMLEEEAIKEMTFPVVVTLRDLFHRGSEIGELSYGAAGGWHGASHEADR